MIGSNLFCISPEFSKIAKSKHLHFQKKSKNLAFCVCKESVKLLLVILK
jgi:hypothetical protein